MPPPGSRLAGRPASPRQARFFSIPPGFTEFTATTAKARPVAGAANERDKTMLHAGPLLEAPLQLSDLLKVGLNHRPNDCLLYTSPSPRDGLLSRMPSSA